MGFRINFWFGFVLLVGWLAMAPSGISAGLLIGSLSLFLYIRFFSCSILVCAVLCGVCGMYAVWDCRICMDYGFEIEERSGAFPSKPSLFFAFHKQILTAQPQNLKMCSLAWWCVYVPWGPYNAFASYPIIHPVLILHKLHTVMCLCICHTVHTILIRRWRIPTWTNGILP